MDKKEHLTVGVRKTKHGYIGFISCCGDATEEWTETSGVERHNKQDALDDASKLRNEVIEIHVTDRKEVNDTYVHQF